MRQHTVQTPYMVGEAHFYSTEIDGELVLFDTGPATPEALACLKEEVDVERLKYIFITHCHVDHYGLAAVIAGNSAAEIFLPRMDAVKLRRHEERLFWIENLLAGFGYDADFTNGLRAIIEKKRIFPELPEKYHIVEE
jgi:2,4-dienoyl-CoA reductase (NADPH2)